MFEYFETENELGVTKIDTNTIFYFDAQDRDLLPKRRKRKFVGANYDASRMHQKVKEREIGHKPEVVNHLNHLEYDNRRCNLENCTSSDNAQDIYGRCRYSILRDCKWCQDLHLLYMTKAITEDEFMYLRLLRLACFPNVVMQNYSELQGTVGYDDLFDKYGVFISTRRQYFDEKKFFMSDPKVMVNRALCFELSIFKFADDLKMNRLEASGFYPDMSAEEQLTALDYLILSEFSEIFIQNGVSEEGFTSALVDYMKVCNYRYRLLWLVKRFYPSYDTSVAEMLFTETLCDYTSKSDFKKDIDIAVENLYIFRLICKANNITNANWGMYNGEKYYIFTKGHLNEVLVEYPNFKTDILDWIDTFESTKYSSNTYDNCIALYKINRLLNETAKKKGKVKNVYDSRPVYVKSSNGLVRLENY